MRFVFGYDAYKPLIERAEGDAASEYEELVRQADAAFESCDRRAKQPRIKEQIVRERGYRNLRLEREDVAEFEHRPNKAKMSYRFIALRKTIVEERGQLCLGQAVTGQPDPQKSDRGSTPRSSSGRRWWLPSSATHAEKCEGPGSPP